MKSSTFELALCDDINEFVFQPDLSDWFLMPENRLQLTLVHLLALVATGVLGVAVLSKRRVSSTLYKAWYESILNCVN